MRNFYYLNLLFFLYFLPTCTTAQNKKENTSDSFKSTLTEANIRSLEKTGVVKCYTIESENALKQKYPNRATTAEFENWLAPKIKDLKEHRTNEKIMNSATIPVIFHILSNGTNTITNLSQSQIQDQIDQLNIDFGNQAGSSYAVSTNSGINFCLAEVDSNGNSLAERGINRITSYGDGPFTQTYYQNSIKPETQWNPNKYMNVWCSNLENGLLGYAQFPDPVINGIDNINLPGSGANTDGVVITSTSVGSVSNPHPSDNQWSVGRTLTHETGHWLGLRHIWGDGNCFVDDYCNDTPIAGKENFQCPTGIDTCPNTPGNDMIENYMDYTDGNCLNTFTQDQVNRMTAIIQNAPRRMELTTSNACTFKPKVAIYNLSKPHINEGNDCSYTDIPVNLILTSESSTNVVASITATGDASLNTDYELINNSVTFPQGSTTPSNPITVRIYNDALIENNETITLTINLNTNGDVEASQNSHTITIVNDDIEITPVTTFTYFSDDFNDKDVSDWMAIDSDGDGNNWGDQFNITNDTNTASQFSSLLSRSWLGDPLTPDNWTISPPIDLSTTSGSINLTWITRVAASSFDQEKYSVHVGTTNSISDLLNSPISITETLGQTDDTGTPVNHSLDISAMAGESTVYIAFRHWDSTDQDFIAVDDVKVSSIESINIQNTVNATTAGTSNLNNNGIAYFIDSASNNIMLEIENTEGINFGCTSVWVSRDTTTAGADAVMYSSNTDVSSFVTAKTFSITTERTNNTDTTNLSFYFTEAEIANWETTTGNSRSNLSVKKESADEVFPISITSFGDDLKLSAIITNGLSGKYYFGTLKTLNTSAFNFQNSFSIYPNPAKTVLNIKTLDSNVPDSYKIYNMLGQLIKSVEINSTLDLTINTTAFSNGMYFVKITKDTNSISIPFIKE